jgi:DNA-directed RNA polymerase alpha subunit
MPNSHYREREGPIPDLRLPQYVWNVLRREKITTIDQLRALMDQPEQAVKRIGPKTAAVIRAELARVATVQEEPRHKPLS